MDWNYNRHQYIGAMPLQLVAFSSRGRCMAWAYSYFSLFASTSVNIVFLLPLKTTGSGGLPDQVGLVLFDCSTGIQNPKSSERMEKRDRNSSKVRVTRMFVSPLWGTHFREGSIENFQPQSLQRTLESLTHINRSAQACIVSWLASFRVQIPQRKEES